MSVTKAQSKIGSTRLTENYERKRVAAPSQFSEMRTISIGEGKKAVIGKSKSTGEWKTQAILTPRD